MNIIANNFARHPQLQLVLRLLGGFTLACLFTTANAACGEDMGLDPGSICVTDADEEEAPLEIEQVSVGEGMTPTLAWEGGDATSITVSDDRGDLWALDCSFHAETRNKNCLSSPLTFGQAPDGVENIGDGSALVEGKRYEVYMTRLDKDDPYCGRPGASSTPFDR